MCVIWSLKFTPDALPWSFLARAIHVPRGPDLYHSDSWCPVSPAVADGLTRALVFVTLGCVSHCMRDLHTSRLLKPIRLLSRGHPCLGIGHPFELPTYPDYDLQVGTRRDQWCDLYRRYDRVRRRRMHCWACTICEPGCREQCLQGRVDEFAPHADWVGRGRGNPWVYGVYLFFSRYHDHHTIIGHRLARFLPRSNRTTYTLFYGQEMGSPGRISTRQE